MKIKNIIVTASMLMGVSSLHASDTTRVESRNITLLKSLWSINSNAAGLGVNRLEGLGRVHTGYFYSSGDYHRAQQGSSAQGMIFGADSYVNLSRILYGYGSFKFGMDRENNRAWSDMRDTYGGNPYTYGSEIKGKYDNQSYELKAKVGTTEMGRFTFGLGVEYATYDMSRLKDPRHRTLALETSVAPSLTYRLSDCSRLGAEFVYEFKKDRMSNVTSVQSNTTFEYFLFKGLENHTVITSLGTVQQQQIASNIGGALSYSFVSDNVHLMLDTEYKRQLEDVIFDNKRSPGDYFAHNYTFGTDLLISQPKVLHLINLRGDIQSGSAQEFIQEQLNITNSNGNVSTQWVTIFKHTTYKNSKMNFDVNYRLYVGAISRDDYKFYVGIGGAINTFSNEYILPASKQEVAQLRGSVNAGVRLIDKKHKLHINAMFAGQLPQTNKLNLTQENLIYTNILRPDKLFFEKKSVEGYVDAIYSFPVGKGKKNKRVFAKLFYDGLFTTCNESWMNTGFSLGLYL